MGGAAGGTGTEQFVGVGVDEERVDVVGGLRRAEAAEGGENDGQEDALLGGVYLISRELDGPGRGSEAVGRREKQKTKNRGPEGGPGPQGPSGLGPRWVGRVGGRWVGGPVGWSTGQVGRVDQWGGRGGWGWLYCCLGGQNAWKSACFEAFRPQNRACGALFLFFC